MVTRYNFVNVTLNPDIRFQMLLLCSFCNNYKNNDKEANESLTINTPNLLKDEIVWLFLLRDMCEMFRSFDSTLFYYNNKSLPQGFSGCRSLPSPFTIVVIFLISQTFSNLDNARAGYKEVAVRFVPIEKGRIF